MKILFVVWLLVFARTLVGANEFALPYFTTVTPVLISNASEAPRTVQNYLAGDPITPVSRLEWWMFVRGDERNSIVVTNGQLHYIVDVRMKDPSVASVSWSGVSLVESLNFGVQPRPKTNSYSPWVVGISPQGEQVLSGQGNTNVNRIVALVSSGYYTASSTNNFETIKKLLVLTDLRVEFRVLARARSSTLRLYENPPTIEQPLLIIASNSNGDVYVTSKNGSPEVTYRLETSQGLNGPWRLLDTLAEGEKVLLEHLETNQFFRVRAQ